MKQRLMVSTPDRPLTHINKKGRPVSQCTHCRGLRKSRAAHVKCDCGEKSHTKGECIFAERTDSKSELSVDDTVSVSDQYAVDQYSCCCTHGARCTCALKRDYLDPVPEMDPPGSSPSSSSIRKPGLTTTRSENSVMVFSNGHHKPAHKHNDMAHKCGAPYKIPRSHTVHGHTDIAQRSMDSLPLITSADGAPSQIHDSIISAQGDVRLSKSEHGSPRPKPGSNFERLNSSLPPLDLPLPAFDNRTGQQSIRLNGTTGFDGYYSPSDFESMTFSAGLSMPPVDWSAFDLPLDTAFSASYSQPPSYASLDHSNIGQSGLTTSSSGEISEVEDLRPLDGFSPPIMGQNHYTSEPSEIGDVEAYRLSTTSSYLGIPQASMLAANNLDSIDIDTFLKGTAPGGSVSNLSTTKAPINPEAFTMHGFTVRDAQKLAHADVNVDTSRDLSLPITQDSVDPLWAASFSETASFDQAEVPETVWSS